MAAQHATAGARTSTPSTSCASSTRSCAQECPGAFTIAEESTAWARRDAAASEEGGLGFTFKWNMGWMHDTLAYFERDPVHRTLAPRPAHVRDALRVQRALRQPAVARRGRARQGQRCSRKMPGDCVAEARQPAAAAGLPVHAARQEAAVHGHRARRRSASGTTTAASTGTCADDPARQRLQRFVARARRAVPRARLPVAQRPRPRRLPVDRLLGPRELRAGVPALGRRTRHARWCVLNFTPVPRDDYRIGVPHGGRYRCILSSDAAVYGGSDFPMRDRWPPRTYPWHGFPHSRSCWSCRRSLALVLQPE